MAKGPADQTAKCGPHNRRPVGHASQHRVGACEGSHAAGLGKIEAICSHPQAGWCVPQWGPSPCGEGRQSSSTRIVQNERKSQTCRQYSMQTQGVPNSPFQGGRTVRCARAVPALCALCAKSRLFSTAGSYGSQGPEFCTLPTPLLVHQGLFFFKSDACHGSQGPECRTPDAVLNGSCTPL